MIDAEINLLDVEEKVNKLFAIAGSKLASLRSWDTTRGSPVFTVNGKYTSRGWTEWTQGFLYGMWLLHFDVTGERDSLEFAREQMVKHMSPHLTHTGVHDHGFNNISTYGNLYRLMLEGKVEMDPWELRFYELALKVSGAVQASRWTELPDGLGYIYSFNGPHSLFIDTIRTLRSLAMSHLLGHWLLEEQDRRVSLLDRLLRHIETTIRYNIYHGTGRDIFDIRGRVAHEAIFNIRSGSFRCPSSQQGYSPFTTWTRGLAWALCGLAEELEFLDSLPEDHFNGIRVGDLEGKRSFIKRLSDTALELSEFYMSNTPTDGIPYWDTGAPGLIHLGDYLNRPADPYNEYEPVDSSAASIAGQGLIRLGRFLHASNEQVKASRYVNAGLKIASTLFDEPYLSLDPNHQGLILHSVYHRPNGWDHIPKGAKVPLGESSMWGDYHALELGLLIHRLSNGQYYTFFVN